MYHHVEEDKRAWHAGVGAWHDIDDLNSHSVGIEMVNPGHEFGYCEFPFEQVKQVEKLCIQIMGRYNIEPENVLGHSDIAPDRKQDPGELFPWQVMAENGVGVWPSISDESFVKAASMDLSQALYDYGYRSTIFQNNVIAFQRHFVPEVFCQKFSGGALSLTKARLYALLAGHLL